MSYVTILWSVAAASALLLGLVHLSVWFADRNARSHLAFSVFALALVGISMTELGMMYAQDARQWGEYVRWCHVPLFFVFTGMLLFVYLHLGTGRAWLILLIVAMRGAILVTNFMVHPNFNFDVVHLEYIPFLGEQVAVIGDAVPSSRQWFATVTGILCLIFIIDASISAWRTGRKETRRRALLVGGSTLLFCLVAIIETQLVIWGVIELPMLITPPFLIPLGVMALELSRGTLHVSRLARDLEESEGRLELAATSAGLGLWSWNGRDPLWMTDRARAMLGFGNEAVVDMEMLLSRMHRDEGPTMRAAFRQAIATGGELAVQFRVCPPHEPERWIAARGSCETGERGHGASIRGTVRDVTDQKRAATETDELRRELAHAGRVTMLGQLASALAHELSQPLGAILRNVEAAEILLARPSPDLEELRAIVADIHKDDRRAGQVIQRLREFFERRQMDFQAISVEGLLADAANVVRPDATVRHVTLECTAWRGLPAVSGDRVHLSQVLINLMINAVDATVEARAGRRLVNVEAKPGVDGSVDIVVADSGSGIPAGQMERIFEPFFTTKSTGLGMGLAVSRTIVEAHGGRLWAENIAGGGAKFHLSLPAAELRA